MAHKKVLEVEALTYSDSIDGLADKHFRGRPSHRADDAGPYDVARMVKVLGEKLVRSRQEYMVAPSGMSRHLMWASLCFQLEADVFALLLAKGNSASRNGSGDDEFKVTVTATSPEVAATTLEKLRKEFLPSAQGTDGPAFFIMTGNRKVQRAILDPKHALEAEELALHYGEPFAARADEFIQGIGTPGISILRGEAGTGKTSFLRHVMSRLTESHRFYFVPVDNFGLLSSGALTDFWKTEQREHPAAAKVLVLEDAEALLQKRNGQSGNAVSSILNLTDGLMTQFIKLHLVCTLNCPREELDKALLRPGRLGFFREFELIPRERALLVAKRYGLKLADKDAYTLAEIFASDKFEQRTNGAVEQRTPIGFGR